MELFFSGNFQKEKSSRGRNRGARASSCRNASAINEDDEVEDDCNNDWLPQSKRAHTRCQAPSQSFFTARAPQPVTPNRQPAPAAPLVNPRTSLFIWMTTELIFSTYQIVANYAKHFCYLLTCSYIRVHHKLLFTNSLRVQSADTQHKSPLRTTTLHTKLCTQRHRGKNICTQCHYAELFNTLA